MRGIDPVRNKPIVKDKLRSLIHRRPDLFTDLKKIGKTSEQIIEEYYDRLVKYIC